MFESAFPSWAYYAGVAGILVLILIIILIILLKAKKPKQKRIKVDDEFINNLIDLLGGIKNIEDVKVDNGRLKLAVLDLEKVNLNGIKEIATSGVFVTGNNIKTLFKLDSQLIKSRIEKMI